MTDADNEPGSRASNFFHMQQVADRLGYTVSGVRGLMARGKLRHCGKRVFKIRGVRQLSWSFDEKDVEALAREFSIGREAAVPELRDQKVIAAYRAGKNPNDVVIELGVPHAVAEEIWKRFRRYEPKDPEAEPSSDDVMKTLERDQREHEARIAKGEEEMRALRARRERARNARKG